MQFSIFILFFTFLIQNINGQDRIKPTSKATTRVSMTTKSPNIHPEIQKKTLHPKQIKQNMKFKGASINLELNLNENINSDIPIIFASRTNLRQLYPAESYAAYYDVKNSVSVVIKLKKHMNGSTMNETPEIVQGVISKNNKVYKFKPSKVNDNRQSEIIVGGRMMDHDEEDAQFMAAQCRALDLQINSTLSKLIRRKRQSAQMGTFTVETLIVVDYSIYNRFYQLSTQTTSTLKNIDAQANVQYYFINIANGVIQRYNSISALNYAVAVRLVGLYIALDSTSSLFTESSYLKYVNNGETLIDAYTAYTQFKRWTSMYAQNNGIYFDQATLFTNYRMYYRSSSGNIHIFTGLGHIGSICQIANTTEYESLSTTINSERGMFASIGTMAHEMGHNLNSLHDGENNACSYNDQYVMAPAPGPLGANNFNNIFKFSSCSNWYFGNFLSDLNYKNSQNCLKVSKAPVYNPPIDQRLPGIKYSLDNQCKIIFGLSSFYCGGDHQSPCALMECFNPAVRACEIRVDIRAFEGSLCGNKKWCIGGFCIFDLNSPATATAKETCIYGDYKGSFGVFNNPSFTCSLLYKGSPDQFRCYDHLYTYARCCSSCDTIKNQNPPNCPYGDRDPSYCQTGTRDRCYDINFNQTCCATCAGWAVNKPGCMYGDKYPNTCKITSNYCYQMESDCCETCSAFYNSSAPYNCRYGDHVTWCNTISVDSCPREIENCCKTCPNQMITSTTTKSGCRDLNSAYCSSQISSNCYYTSTKDYCCATCQVYYTGISGCEYGNRATWCDSYITNPDQCKDANTLLSCCKTCKDYNGATTARPEPTCSDTDLNYCNNIKSADCYFVSAYCCSTCKKYYSPVKIGCEYGDKASWCSSYVTSYQSCTDPNVVENCCNSCLRYGTVTTTTTTIAPCSDLAFWCSTLYSGQCYDSQTEATCCSTCSRFRKPSLNCKYGDKYSWCAPIYCATDKQNCCVSCP